MKILIYVERADRSNHILNGSCVDIFRQSDYRTLADDIKKYRNGIATNTGNRVWFQGLVSELTVPDNELYYHDGSEGWNEINEKYDCVVFSVANLINPYYKKEIQFLADEIKQCKIPAFMISIGAQAKSYDDLTFLCESVSHETEALIHAVYETGGEIACRGYYTKEVFDRICNNTAEVVGCPSLFQNGERLSIPIEKVPLGKLKPVVNGSFFCKDNVFAKYPEAVFIDQEKWFYYFYDINQYLPSRDGRIVDAIIKSFGKEQSDLFFNRRLNLFWDIPEWHRFLIQNGYNFSIGTRIHGTIMSILSGIPSAMCAIDSRTREMSEYYNIPLFFPNDCKSCSLYELYTSTDYSKFNLLYPRLYQKFHGFLQKHNLVDKINGDNIFWGKEAPLENVEVTAKIAQLSKIYNKRKWLYCLSADLREMRSIAKSVLR